MMEHVNGQLLQDAVFAGVDLRESLYSACRC
jgi:hypothetical protein